MYDIKNGYRPEWWDAYVAKYGEKAARSEMFRRLKEHQVGTWLVSYGAHLARHLAAHRDTYITASLAAVADTMAEHGWCPDLKEYGFPGYGAPTKPALSPSRKGAPRGAPSKYPLATMELGGTLSVPAGEQQPKINSFRSYLTTRGKDLDRKFQCQLQPDGSYLVRRTA